MFIKDGNFAPWLRLTFLVIGICIGIVSFTIRSFLLMSVGLGIAALGGYASRAATLKIKPFDSSYKKAKASYGEAEEANKPDDNTES